MNKHELPLSLLRNTKKLIADFNKLAVSNEDIIQKVVDEDAIISFEYKKNEIFNFGISNPNITGDFKSFFYFNYLPKDEHSLKRASFNNELDEIKRHFQIWIALVREFDSIDLKDEDAFEKFYEDEFYSDFEILDEDAFVNPFDHQRQLILYEFLVRLEQGLKTQPESSETNLLIEETIEVKDNIQRFTKSVVLTKISKILSKIKKKGIPFFLDVMKDTAKEIFKKALTGGFEELSLYLHHHTF